MKLVKAMKGFRPLTFVPDGILLAKGYELYVADLECLQLVRITSVPRSWLSGGLRLARTLERIFRLGVRFGCHIGDSTYLLAEGARIWKLDLSERSVSLDHVVGRESRPLLISRIEGIDGFDDCASYGEYWENKNREPVNVWVRSPRGPWRVAYTFPRDTVEHVHGVIPDSKRGLVWILTGDFGDSAGIWVARDNFAEVTPVVTGKQDFRCCWLAFWGERIIYATDSHFEANSIRELVTSDENSVPSVGAHSRFIMETSGSSIYACMVRDELVFSTTVEPGLLTGRRLYDLLERRPGPGIKGTHADLIVGAVAQGFSLAGRWQKDRLPSRLCEFGSISFPTGINPGRFLYAYFTGLSGLDGSMGVFELH